MSIEAPKDWIKTTLADAAGAYFTDGDWVESKDQDANGEVRLIQLADIGDGRFLDKSARFLTTDKARDLRCTLLKEGDLLIARMADPIARCCIFPAINQPAATVVDVAIARAREGVDQSYLSYAVSNPSFRALAQGAASGTTRSRISRSNLGALPIVLPPLNEQRNIAEVLRTIDEVIAANRALLNHLSRVRVATLHTAFEETSWETVPLADLGRWSSGGTPSKADDSLWNGDIPWICPRDMKTPVVTRAESTVTSKAIGGACKVVPEGTLLLVVRGMILAKAIPTATTAMSATYNQDIKAFNPNGRATPKFIQLCLQHQERSLLKKINTATHGTKKLDAQTIAEVEIPLPDIDAQRALSETIMDMDLAMVRYGEEYIRLVRMKAAIQSDLLSGRVRVPA